MATARTDLESRARRAYETGRVFLGLRRAAVVLPMAAVSLLGCGRPWATAVIAGALAASVGFLEWWGEGLGRGARVGLGAGVPPLLLPVVVRTAARCTMTFCLPNAAACLGGGAVAGALVGVWVVRRGLSGPTAASAAAIAALTGSLGCLVAGSGGLIGLAAGLALGAAPMIALRRA